MLTREDLNAMKPLADRTVHSVRLESGFVGIYTALSLVIADALKLMDERDQLKQALDNPRKEA